MRIVKFTEIAPETRALIRNYQWPSTAPLPPGRQVEFEKAWREYSAALAQRNPDHMLPGPPWRTWYLVGYRFEWLPEAERPCSVHTLFSIDCWWARQGCLLDGRTDAFVVRGDQLGWLAEDLAERVLT